MRPSLQRARRRLPRGLLIWACLTLLFAAAVLISLSDLAGVPAAETIRANRAQQRVIIDPVSGVVSGLGNTEAAPFDVAAPTTEEPHPPTEKPPVAEAETETPPPSEPAATSIAASGMQPLRQDAATEFIPTVARDHDSLVNAPAPEISEKVGKELLPKRGEKDSMPARLYARQFARDPQQRLLSIVITDVGFSAESLDQILQLPGEISVGFSPYADHAADQIAALRNKGHEVWGMLPLMGKRYPQDDPGPLGLIAALHIKGALARLHTVLANTIGSVGLILPPDEQFTAAADLWGPVRDELFARGLYVLSSNLEQPVSNLGGDAKQQAMVRRADVLLDSTPGAAFIRSKLSGLRDKTVAQKKLVVLLSARPQTLALLAEWLKNAPLGDQAVLAPLSAIYLPDAPPPAPAAPAGEHGKAEKTEGHR